MRKTVPASVLVAFLACACGPQLDKEPTPAAAAPGARTTSTIAVEASVDADSQPRTAAEIRAKNEAMFAKLRKEQEVQRAGSEDANEQTTQPERTLEDVLAEALEAVVTVDAGSSTGSGFFIEPSIVVSNLHVVGNRRLVNIRNGDNQRQARVIQTAPRHDLVLLEVYEPDPDQQVLALGSIEDVAVGQEVVAIGSAFSLEATATRGIVSAIRTANDVTFVQTDAAINPGNSGGPLLNAAGEAIGINAAKLANSESLGLAIAADHIKALRENAGPLKPLSVAASTQDDQFSKLFAHPGTSRQPRVPDVESPRDRFERAMDALAQEADEVDVLYKQLRRECRVELDHDHSTPRVMITLSMRQTTSISSREGCRSRLVALEKTATSIVTRVTNTISQAQRDGVERGTINYVRRLYRLYW